MPVAPATLIITTYNQEHSLRMLLVSVERQIGSTQSETSGEDFCPDFEVIVADDGSSDGTAELCREKWSFPLLFLTQPDQGYRKAKMLNEAIRSATSDYLIFMDGDVILEQHFVQDHLHLRRPGHFVCGRRVDLGPVVSKRVTLEDVRAGRWEGLNFSLLLSALISDTRSWKRALRITSSPLRRLLGYDQPLDILGSNFSAWKSDLCEVNGFNESMQSYWGEDGDLFIRLRNSGKKAIGAKSLCIQLHVFHHRREPNLEAVKKYQELLENTEYKWAIHGLSDSNEGRK